MITLRRGNKLPTVAVFQSFLNQRGGADIKVDGIFGKDTQEAVRNLQHRLGKSRSGRVNYDLWRSIVSKELQFIDSVDLTDTEIKDDQDLSPYGQTVIRQYGASLGARKAIIDIQQKAKMGQVVLLRFHGHGSPGSMVVTGGKSSDFYTGLEYDYEDTFDAFFSRLRPIFSPVGSIEMHGCRVGAGRRGLKLLTRLANAAQVPVTAGRLSQYGGGRSTFRFEGPTRTICPRGQSLKEWAKSTCRYSFM